MPKNKYIAARRLLCGCAQRMKSLSPLSYTCESLHKSFEQRRSRATKMTRMTKTTPQHKPHSPAHVFFKRYTPTRVICLWWIKKLQSWRAKFSAHRTRNELKASLSGIRQLSWLCSEPRTQQSGILSVNYRDTCLIITTARQTCTKCDLRCCFLLKLALF